MTDPDSPSPEPIRDFGPFIDPADAASVEDYWAAEEEWVVAVRRLALMVLTKSRTELEEAALQNPEPYKEAMKGIAELVPWLEMQLEMMGNVSTRLAVAFAKADRKREGEEGSTE
jgi:hypothetical protein